ncbi:unnamed protein product, partial [Amoebophrya sp. A120]
PGVFSVRRRVAPSLGPIPAERPPAHETEERADAGPATRLAVLKLRASRCVVAIRRGADEDQPDREHASRWRFSARHQAGAGPRTGGKTEAAARPLRLMPTPIAWHAWAG